MVAAVDGWGTCTISGHSGPPSDAESAQSFSRARSRCVRVVTMAVAVAVAVAAVVTMAVAVAVAVAVVVNGVGCDRDLEDLSCVSDAVVATTTSRASTNAVAFSFSVFGRSAASGGLSRARA